MGWRGRQLINIHPNTYYESGIHGSDSTFHIEARMASVCVRVLLAVVYSRLITQFESMKKINHEEWNTANYEMVD